MNFASIEVLIVVLDQCYHPKYLNVCNIDLLQIIAIKNHHNQTGSHLDRRRIK